MKNPFVELQILIYRRSVNSRNYFSCYWKKETALMDFLVINHFFITLEKYFSFWKNICKCGKTCKRSRLLLKSGRGSVKFHSCKNIFLNSISNVQNSISLIQVHYPKELEKDLNGTYVRNRIN